MNFALIFAGGVGSRMNYKDRPKQFLEIHGKPIIIHTIEHFEFHESIDSIIIVCVAEWIDYLAELIDKSNFKKVRTILPGGKSALESQYIGLKHLAQNSSQDDVVLIHDGVRPMINKKTISDCISSVQDYGSAVTVAPATETIIKLNSESVIAETINRSDCMLARAPQAFFINDILKAHEEARASGKYEFVDSASLMLHFGHKVHVVEGPSENIKVTTPIDFYMCRALLDTRENKQMNGL